MQIRLLGTAAGGGVPQWNCHCAVCREARAGSGRVRARTQSSVAISADGRSWFLLNASPDIRAQIENFPPLQPAGRTPRNSPIEAVLLTNADLDHTLGLLLLREGERLRIHATQSVRLALSEGISFEGALGSFCGTEWIEPPTEAAPLLRRDGSTSGLRYEAIPLSGKPPRFFRAEASGAIGAVPTGKSAIQQARKPALQHVVGYRITDEKTGGRLLFLPDVAELNETLLRLLPECDAMLFDGTFWSETEMRDHGIGTLVAADMGHAPISGAAGSLKVLAELKLRHKIYTHINNTNPILMEDSPECAAVKAAGCGVGRDGMEIEI
jgi:pyrroloquinoline quinone biosynthesis protein B